MGPDPPPILEIMAPRSGGFSKRFALALCAFRPRHDPVQEIRWSRTFLIDYYDWLSFNALGLDDDGSGDDQKAAAEDAGDAVVAGAASDARVAYCDPGSKVIFAAVQEAVSDVQEELEAEGVRINPYFQEKVDYWDTDLCHYANATMREVQYCTSLTKLPEAATAHARVAWTPEETVYALHNWHRQLRWHYAIIQAARVPEEVEHAHPRRPTDCSQVERHAAQLLREPRFKREENSAKLRDRLKNKMSREKLLEAVSLLVDKRIVSAPGLEEAAKRQKRSFTVKKRTWDELSQDEDAMQFLKRLRINRDCFEL